MALQNVRSLLWRGEDLGFGNGNSREVTFASTVVAAARPTIITRAFVGSCDISTLLPAASPWATNGKQRLLVNRNARYWLTVSGSMFTTNSSTSFPCSFPIAPLQTFYLPVNFGGTVVVSANSTWPIPQPLSGSPGATVPLATSTQQLTFDVMVEQ